MTDTATDQLATGLQLLDPERLYESPDNPRTISSEALDRLKYSLTQDPGMMAARPIIASTAGEVIAGNMRLRAQKELGATEVWVYVHDFRDEAQKREWMLRDNQEYGDWVPDELAALIKAHADEGGDLGLLGFAEPELDELLALAREAEDAGGISGQVTAGPTLADRFVVPPFTVLDARRGEWRSRKGDWLSLGIKSELGRTGENIGKAALHATSANDPRFYEAKRQKEAALGRALSTEEFLRDHYRTPDRDDSALAEGGTSVFDPVLCELAYRWFSPEGGLVLDPFAGGSVRGVVAAMLGRRYLGIDLRDAQVEANRQQAAEIVGGSGPADQAGTGAPAPPAEGVHDPAAPTPVERRGGVLVKRDDLFSINGAPGGKARTCLALATHGGTAAPAGLVTAGSRHSPQVNIVARVAQHLGVPCRVHTPEGDPGPEVAEAVQLGAERVTHKPGHNTVIVARAREDAHASGWVHVPFGMEHTEAVEQTAQQAQRLPWGEFQRIVVPVGSGMSLAGIIEGRNRAGQQHVPILGVVVGADPAKRLAKYAAPLENVQLVPAGVPYDEHVHADLDGLVLDPVYEAKCHGHLQDGDLLWIVGIRPSHGGQERGHGPAGLPATRQLPEWLVGDCLEVLRTPDFLRSEGHRADLVFSCPPYHDLERYSDDPADLSNQESYEQFRVLHDRAIHAAVAQLRDDRFAVWVIGDVRDKKTGLQLPLVADTIRSFQDAGCSYYGEAIYVTPVGSLRIRAAKAFITGRKLGRTHQQLLVFVKGDPRRAADAAGPVDAAAIAEAADNAAEE